MKRKIFTFVFILISIFSLQANDFTQNEKFTAEITDCFVNFLEDNYEGDTVEMYQSFMKDFSSIIIDGTNKDGKNKFDLDLKIKKDEVRKINKKLLERNNGYYYYYFNELIVISEENYKYVKPVCDFYKSIPFKIVLIKSIKNENFTTHYEAYNVNLNPNGGFLQMLEKNKDNKFANYIIEQSLAIGEISLYDISAGFSKDEYKHWLNDEISREIVSILFWKFLCLESGSDFYRTIGVKQYWEMNINKYILRKSRDYKELTDENY